MEKREITELSAKRIANNLIVGILVGITIQSLTIVMIYLNDGYNIIAVNPLSFIIIPLTVAFSVAIFEEILMRGIIFRIIEEKLGSVIVLIISSLSFGGMHLFNLHASVLSASCIAIEAGLLMGAAYIYSRSLWMPIAIHFAWNFMQSGIFGTVTSGTIIPAACLKCKSPARYT